MKRQDAYEFWLTYMKLITKDGADIEMSNPLHDFKAQAHAGDFDELSDETYYERYERAEEVASFWKGASEKAVGKVFLEALKQTPIGEAEVKDLTMMLAEISERTTYDWEERNREAEKSKESEAKRGAAIMLYHHMKDIFLEEPTEKVKKLLVVIDEADKLFEPMVGSGGTDFSRAIQNEFLKVMDGEEVTFLPKE